VHPTPWSQSHVGVSHLMTASERQVRQPSVDPRVGGAKKVVTKEGKLLRWDSQWRSRLDCVADVPRS
jgi:hypothetical protein